MYEFTPGQISKMEKDVKKYRPTLMKNIYSKYQWFNFVSLSFLFFKFMHSLKLSSKNLILLIVVECYHNKASHKLFFSLGSQLCTWARLYKGRITLCNG